LQIQQNILFQLLPQGNISLWAKQTNIAHQAAFYIVACRPIASWWPVQTEQRNASHTRWRRATIEEMLQAVFSVGPLWGYMTRPTEFSWVSVVQCSAVERVGWWVRGLLRFSPCELLLLEAGSWNTGTVREPRGRGTSTVESRYQTKKSEDTEDWEGSVRAVVNCSMCELAIAL
jgi:hypothetical protein